jgi:hypothetical protein
LNSELSNVQGNADRIGKEREQLRKKQFRFAAALDQGRAAKEEETKWLTRTQEELSKSLQDEVSKGNITIRQVRDRPTINMVDRVLFDSGQAQVKPHRHCAHQFKTARPLQNKLGNLDCASHDRVPLSDRSGQCGPPAPLCSRLRGHTAPHLERLRRGAIVQPSNRDRAVPQVPQRNCRPSLDQYGFIEVATRPPEVLTLARMIHEGVSRTRADAKRDGHSEP